MWESQRKPQSQIFDDRSPEEKQVSELDDWERRALRGQTVDLSD